MVEENQFDLYLISKIVPEHNFFKSEILFAEKTSGKNIGTIFILHFAYGYSIDFSMIDVEY